jgi:hypothetical protein
MTDDLGRYRIYGLEPGEYLAATEGMHVVVGSSARGGNSSATLAAEPAGFPATFHPSAVNDAAAQRIRLGAGRTASGIDILVARGQLADVSGLVLDSRGAPAPAASGLFSRDGACDLTPSPGSGVTPASRRRG